MDTFLGNNGRLTMVPAEGFSIKSINGDESLNKYVGTVKELVIDGAAFVNGLLGEGELIVTKSVITEMENYTVAKKTFNAEITFVNSSGQPLADTELSCTDSKGTTFTKTTDDTGKIVIDISDGECVIINDIPETGDNDGSILLMAALFVVCGGVAGFTFIKKREDNAE